MHETLRRRILRRLETLPEPKLYQVLDYIESLNLNTLPELKRKRLVCRSLRSVWRMSSGTER